MENIQIKSEYSDYKAKKIIEGVKSNGVFLNTEEAVDIANKLEQFAELEKELIASRADTRDLLCCALKVLMEIRDGKSLTDVCDEYGIELPNEERNYGFFIYKTLFYLNTYIKTKITKTKTSETTSSKSYNTTRFLADGDKIDESGFYKILFDRY